MSGESIFKFGPSLKPQSFTGHSVVFGSSIQTDQLQSSELASLSEWIDKRERERERDRDRDRDRETDRQTDMQADRQTGRQTDRQTDRQAGRQTGRQEDRDKVKEP